MADVKTLNQFSVFLVNKPGVLAQVTGALAAEKINLLAMTLVDSQEHGVLRMVIDNAAQARDVLKKLNLPMTETEVLCGVGPKLMELLKITRLDRILVVKPTQQDAVKVFDQPL